MHPKHKFAPIKKCQTARQNRRALRAAPGTPVPAQTVEYRLVREDALLDLDITNAPQSFSLPIFGNKCAPGFRARVVVLNANLLQHLVCVLGRIDVPRLMGW
jgi:hypothetical protein